MKRKKHNTISIHVRKSTEYNPICIFEKKKKTLSKLGVEENDLIKGISENLQLTVHKINLKWITDKNYKKASRKHWRKPL